MKNLIVAIFILFSSICYGQSPLNFPLQLKAGMTLTAFKSHMKTKLFESENRWYEMGKGKDSAKKFLRVSSYWKESDIYKEFTTEYNIKEFTYTGVCPNIGTIKPDMFAAFFVNDKLTAIKIIFNPEYSYDKIKEIIETKYGTPTSKDAEATALANHFCVWDDKNILIKLANTSAIKNTQSYLEYNDINSLKSAKKEKSKKETIDF